MKRRLTIVTLLALLPLLLAAQAGQDVFQFLNLPTGARLAGFGGTNISIYDDDINFALANPAMLSENTHNMLGFNYTNQFSDINIGSAVYGRNFGKKNFMAFGAHYIDFGKFLETTPTDEIIGSFTAKDVALNIVYTRWLSPRWTVGTAMKPIFSAYERYTSFGLAFDFGISYHNEKALFSAGLTLRNAGFQFNGYHSIDGKQNRETLPLDLQIGLSQRFHHAPIRLSMTIHNLQSPNLGYDKNSNIKGPSYTEPSRTAEVFDMIFRHTIFNIEVLPTKNTYIVISYNHRRQAEMAVKGRRSIAGFAFGAGVKLYKFHLGASVVPYQTGQLSYNITLSTSLTEFGVK